MKLTGEPKLQVKIMSPTQTHYDGKALSLSAVNKVGQFDILENHANFFSLLDEGDVVVNTGFQTLTFPVKQGIVKAGNNIITLFIDIEPAQADEPQTTA